MQWSRTNDRKVWFVCAQRAQPNTITSLVPIDKQVNRRFSFIKFNFTFFFAGSVLWPAIGGYKFVLSLAWKGVDGGREGVQTNRIWFGISKCFPFFHFYSVSCHPFLILLQNWIAKTVSIERYRQIWITWSSSWWWIKYERPDTCSSINTSSVHTQTIDHSIRATIPGTKRERKRKKKQRNRICFHGPLYFRTSEKERSAKKIWDEIPVLRNNNNIGTYTLYMVD